MLLLQAVRIRAPITRMRTGTQVRLPSQGEGGDPGEVPITGARPGTQVRFHHRDQGGDPGEAPITG